MPTERPGARHDVLQYVPGIVVVLGFGFLIGLVVGSVVLGLLVVMG